MKFVLRTMKNANGEVVFAKERVGKGFNYLAKDTTTGQVGKVTKAWILSNHAEISNVGISGEKIYPVKSNRAVCDVCGEKHNTSTMLPIYEVEGAKAFKSARMICKDCLTEEMGRNYVQCGDCKQVFETFAYGYKPGAPRGWDFKVFVASTGQTGTIEYLCSDCDGQTYSVCTGCENESFGQCIIKKSDYSKKAGFYDCHKSCVNMVREARMYKDE